MSGAVPLPALPPPAERRRLRERMGLSRAEVAAMLGVHPRTLLRWEYGDARPTPAHQRAYGVILDQWRTADDGGG